ncbi:hypothetical protein I302_104595 [Kwoniella bestiolae CBS 10118]|uniref:Uncharacterized protein n=1 Tax=Kwoniella bestiolae CBS 10118 TaxID=1296100 RepID=A0A1B9GBP4_9TREE|nr:hypothetical protein I302_03301 [Kwoniella bestiolae CBS 10118]OCF28442.1 hypothetical protein I302_03301 [Kwoniella bestiolae CBS 10118]
MVLKKTPIQRDDTTDTLPIREGSISKVPTTSSDGVHTAVTMPDASVQQPTVDHSSAENAIELKKYDDVLAEDWTDSAITAVASFVDGDAHSSLKADMSNKFGWNVTLPVDSGYEKYIKKEIEPMISTILNEKRHGWESEVAPLSLDEYTLEAKYKNFVDYELKVSQVPNEPTRFTLQYGETTKTLKFPRYGCQPDATLVEKWVKSLENRPRDNEGEFGFGFGPSRA